jgi:hypothetical protein
MLLCEEYFRMLEFGKQVKCRENLVFLGVGVLLSVLLNISVSEEKKV